MKAHGPLVYALPELTIIVLVSGTNMLYYMYAELKGKAIVKVDKWFPSSKTCCARGYIHKELLLKDRVCICPACGNVMGRDVQAAVNIDREGLRIFLEEEAGTLAS